jgi:DNA-binding NtrC family response regulator
MTARILFVDDEPSILAGFRRLFGSDYHVDTAPGAVDGLTCIAGSGPYSIVLSDMRMPGMSGIEILARVREVSPESVRMVLTGEADFTAALRALNEGTIFRLLFKPCAEKTLRTAIEAAQRQYELQRAEQTLLDETLRATVAVLVDVLSLVDPATFGRSTWPQCCRRLVV